MKGTNKASRKKTVPQIDLPKALKPIQRRLAALEQHNLKLQGKTDNFMQGLFGDDGVVAHYQRIERDLQNQSTRINDLEQHQKRTKEALEKFIRDWIGV